MTGITITIVADLPSQITGYWNPPCDNRAMSTSAGIYCRISRDKSGAGHGVERQQRDCRTLAEHLGWEVEKVYVDNDISAYSGKARPQYQAMLADIGAGVVTGVIAWHPDRLHRAPTELEA